MPSPKLDAEYLLAHVLVSTALRDDAPVKIDLLWAVDLQVIDLDVRAGRRDAHD